MVLVLVCGILIVSLLILWLNWPRIAVHLSLEEVKGVGNASSEDVDLVLQIDIHSTRGGTYPIETARLIARDGNQRIETQAVDEIPEPSRGTYDVPAVVSPSRPFSKRLAWRVDPSVRKVKFEVVHSRPWLLRWWLDTVGFGANQLVTTASKWVDVSVHVYAAELAKDEVQKLYPVE